MAMDNRNKGFTLMEILIVVAIIVALVAVAMPAFFSSLKKARQAAELANARAAYAAASVRIMMEGLDPTILSGGQFWIDTQDQIVSGNKTYTPIITIGTYENEDEAIEAMFISVVAKKGTVEKDGASKTYAEYRKTDFFDYAME